MILQQVGNVQYIGWRMEFSCREDFVNDLQHQAKKMEDELEEWNRKVADTRKKYYELNYYTTRQLLVLRSELGQLRKKYKLPQQGQVITLLSSISMEIAPEVVERVVCDVSSQLMQVKETAKNKATETKCREPVLGEVATLTSSLYAQSQDRAPSAASVQSLSLSKETLNEIQTKSFTNLTQKYGMDEKEALEAIQRFPNYDDIETWLKTEFVQSTDNDDNIEENIDDEDIQSESDESESDESEDELLKFDQECSQGRFFILRLNPKLLIIISDVFAPGIAPPSPNSQSRTEVTYREPVDENNREVKVLLGTELGTPEQCIMAIKVHETARVVVNRIMQMSEDILNPMDHVCKEGTIPREHIIELVCVKLLSFHTHTHTHTHAYNIYIYIYMCRFFNTLKI